MIFLKKIILLLKDQTINSYQNIIKLDMRGTPYNETDWVGIFKQGNEYVRNNLLAWTYITPDNIDNNLYGGIQTLLTVDKNGLAAGLYDIVYYT